MQSPPALACPVSHVRAAVACRRAADAAVHDPGSPAARSSLAACITGVLAVPRLGPSGLGRVDDPGDTVSMTDARAAVASAIEGGYRLGQATCGHGRGLGWREIRRRAFRAEVEHQGGNVTRAARALGVSRSSIYDALRE